MGTAGARIAGRERANERRFGSAVQSILLLLLLLPPGAAAAASPCCCCCCGRWCCLEGRYRASPASGVRHVGRRAHEGLLRAAVQKGKARARASPDRRSLSPAPARPSSPGNRDRGRAVGGVPRRMRPRARAFPPSSEGSKEGRKGKEWGKTFLLPFRVWPYPRAARASPSRTPR